MASTASTTMVHYWSSIEPIWDEVNIYDGGERFLTTFRAVKPELGHLYAAHFCQSEVCNGGFRQFFSNSTGVLAPEAIEGFRSMGLTSLADVVARAVALFEFPYPRERSDRGRVLAHMANTANTAFDSLDNEFFRLASSECGGFVSAANAYAAQVAA